MKKIIGILFLVLFLAMQYGKLIGYWSCKITNTSDIGAVQCACEKILAGTTGNDDDNFLARSQTTEKVDEWFSPFVSLGVSPKYCNITGTFFPHISISSLSGCARLCLSAAKVFITVLQFLIVVTRR